MSRETIDRYHGFHLYDDGRDRAIAAWMAQQKEAGVSVTTIIKEYLYRLASGQGDDEAGVAAQIAAVRADVAEVRSLLAHGVTLSDNQAGNVDDDADDVVTAFGNIGT